MRMIFAGLLTLSLLPGAFAQDVTPQREELERRRQTAEQIRKTAEEAKKTALKEPLEAVTYEDVLKDPDNVELNFRYARTLVSGGELLKAAGTLERILMVNPELPKVRLFYASVLFRLDNLEDADREIKTLTKQNLKGSMRQELEGYIAQIRQRRKKTRLGISLAAGLDFDENRNSAPASGTRLALDIPVILDEASTRKNDTTKTMTASLNATHDLGYQAGHTIFAAASYYRAEQTIIRTLNLQSINWSAGGTFKSPLVSVTGTMSFGHLILAEATYQRSHGPSLRFDRKLGERVSAFGTVGYQRQDYARTKVVPTADERTGDQHSGGVGFSAAVARGLSLTASYTYTWQGAREPFNVYRRNAYNLSMTQILGKGRFAVLSFTPQFDFYKEPDRTISQSKRIDNTYRTQLTFGTPVPWVDELLLTLSYEYFHGLSNLPNNAYTNNKLSSSLTYRLDF